MSQPGGQCRGLARARTGQHQHRAFDGQHGLTLRRIEALQIGGLRGQGGEFGHSVQLGR